MIKFIMIMLTGSYILISCSDGIVSELPIDTQSIKIRSTFSSIQNELFDKYCIRCHSGNNASGGLNLLANNSYNNLVNKLNSTKTEILVIPGNSKTSYLIKRLSNNNNPMPPTGKIENYLLDSLSKWIDDGAILN